MSMATEERLAPREGAALPREVVAWLRSLHLPRTIRHPKRDLSNGFIVAVICSRYWTSLSMHTYEDKLSVSNKRRNWDQLRKQFGVNGCPLSDRMVRGMIDCSDGYADSFLRQLYTNLRGRPLMEAAPLSAPVVEPTPCFVPQSTSRTPQIKTPTTSVDGEESRGVPKDSPESRVQRLPPRSAAAVIASQFQQQMHTDSRLSQEYEAEQARGMGMGQRNSVQMMPLSGDALTGNGSKPPVSFAVSLRRAPPGRTVVRDVISEGTPGNVSAANGVISPGPLTGARGAANEWFELDEDAPPVVLVEAIVRSQAVGQDWPVPDGSFMSYFLRNEASLGALMQCRVWGSLLAQTGDIVERALRHGGAIGPIAEPILGEYGASKHSGTTGTFNVSTTSNMNRNGSITVMGDSTSGGTAGVLPHRLSFLASLLTGIADADPFLAATVFADDIVPYAIHILSTLDVSGADAFAALLCAVLPADRRLASRLFTKVFASMQDAIGSHTPAVALRERCQLLRAVLLRVMRRPARMSIKEQYPNFSDLAQEGEEVTMDVDGGKDPLVASTASVAGEMAVAALSHESFSVRLAGLHLTEALATAGTASRYNQWLPLLLRLSGGVDKNNMYDMSAYDGSEINSRSGNMDGSAVVTPSPMLSHCLCASTLLAAVRHRHLAPFFVELATELGRMLHSTVSAGAAIRIFMAQQLAIAVGYFPLEDHFRPSSAVSSLASCVIGALDEAPNRLTTAFFSLRPTDASFLRSRLTGPLRVGGALRDCNPLLLAEAVLSTFPVDDTHAASFSMPRSERSGSTFSVHSTGSGPSHHRTSNANALSPLPGGSVTRLIRQRSNMLLRDRAVPEGMSKRITWFYRICVACRDVDNTANHRGMSETVVIHRWRQVMRQMYRDIAVVSMAAELLFAQQVAMVDSAANVIGQMAGMAQQVVLRWHEDITRSPGGLPASGPNGAALRQSGAVASQERLAEAMRWFHKTFGEGERRGSQMAPST